MSARGFLGAGDLYIARMINGVFDAWRGPYEANKFEIKPNTELKEAVSKGRNTYGQVVETVALAKPSEFTVELTEVNKESLSIALLGTAITFSQSSGTAVAQAFVARKDGWVDLPKGNILDAGFVLTDSTAATTYVDGVDYIVNRVVGMVKVLAASAIVEGAALKVSYGFGAVAGTKISGGTNAQIRAKFRLDGVNFADDSPCIVNVFEGVIAASTAFDFLSSDFAKVTMPGKMKTPVDKTEPFTVDLIDLAA